MMRINMKLREYVSLNWWLTKRPNMSKDVEFRKEKLNLV